MVQFTASEAASAHLSHDAGAQSDCTVSVCLAAAVYLDTCPEASTTRGVDDGIVAKGVGQATAVLCVEVAHNCDRVCVSACVCACAAALDVNLNRVCCSRFAVRCLACTVVCQDLCMISPNIGSAVDG